MPSPPTLEVRWFDKGTPPADLDDWFTRFDNKTERSWTDLYLPSSDPSLNLKVRDNMLQIKRRLGEPTRHTFSPQAEGVYEQWIKWSFDLSSDAAGPRVDDPTNLWTPVEKTRKQYRIGAETQANKIPEVPSSPPARLLVELTRLQTTDGSAWTLCLEATGPPAGLRTTLTTAGATLFDERFPVRLTEDASIGYVEWLQRLPSVQSGAAPDVLIPAFTGDE